MNNNKERVIELANLQKEVKALLGKYRGQYNKEEMTKKVGVVRDYEDRVKMIGKLVGVMSFDDGLTGAIEGNKGIIAFLKSTCQDDEITERVGWVHERFCELREQRVRLETELEFANKNKIIVSEEVQSTIDSIDKDLNTLVMYDDTLGSTMDMLWQDKLATLPAGKTLTEEEFEIERENTIKEVLIRRIIPLVEKTKSIFDEVFSKLDEAKSDPTWVIAAANIQIKNLENDTTVLMSEKEEKENELKKLENLIKEKRTKRNSLKSALTVIELLTKYEKDGDRQNIDVEMCIEDYELVITDEELFVLVGMKKKTIIHKIKELLPVSEKGVV